MHIAVKQFLGEDPSPKTLEQFNEPRNIAAAGLNHLILRVAKKEFVPPCKSFRGLVQKRHAFSRYVRARRRPIQSGGSFVINGLEPGDYILTARYP